jgi:hypothetical protein
MACMALLSGPAAASADARKNKKKKSSMSFYPPPQNQPLKSNAESTSEPKPTNPDAMILTPPEIQRNISTITILAPAPLTDISRLSQAIVPYTPSETSPTPPPLPSAPLMDKDSPSPPTSPTPYRKSAVLSALDSDPFTLLTTQAPDTENSTPPGPGNAHALTELTTLSLLEVPHTPNLTSSLVARLLAAASCEITEEHHGQLHNPLKKYTDTDMLQVYDVHPMAILDYINLQLVAKWEQCPGEKLLAQAFDHAPLSDGHLSSLHSKLFAATTDITQSKEIGVAAPIPSEDTIKSRHFPSAFLIYNLSPQHRTLLLSHYIWASQNITFCITLLSPVCPDFLFTLRDLSTMLEKDIYDLVYSVWNNRNTANFLTSIVNTSLEENNVKTAQNLRTFIALMHITCLDVKGKGDTPTPCFNVYTNGSIIQDNYTWCCIKSYFTNRVYSSLLLGWATPQHTPYLCGLCHGADHLCGLCPFPNVIGWNGPPLCPAVNMRCIGNN